MQNEFTSLEEEAKHKAEVLANIISISKSKFHVIVYILILQNEKMKKMINSKILDLYLLNGE